jgi:hypothetical protein
MRHRISIEKYTLELFKHFKNVSLGWRYGSGGRELEDLSSNFSTEKKNIF